ncbi:ATPase, P-type (transporting), HAD superfamily, subfamily IC/heavy metal translocating P-type ATPase [Rhodoblastus acidophilus]|uniref:P-type Zn(2+) transporter n=1 Tax=Rhodoblastus acidophilus TaxID=1074 RepID=A0A212Q058_RHOAC|nr:heavy metal translocating P-type ATPase [Rhodoblastus acidophilus]PPQ36620.1 heavy metal translocating P-type ATPase [Rhodoblastus acidophilus]RAI20473.1 heavy metal translocating P-type ATPase [Rhodoblastus acidophilus]SNB52578.1 ATPase, P-type (transporting), HAD superfamily, subfamily IC/heavy metal translocating P-type ATPase [Rhodoblastus acidophilus]
MTAAPWLRTLEVAHRLPGRVRLRYRRNAHAPDAAVLEGMARLIDGVTSARVNARAASLVIDFDAQRTTLMAIVTALGDLGWDAVKARPRDDEGAGAVAAALAVLVGASVAPMPARLPLSLAAALPMLRAGVDDYRENGVTSHVLESMAVAISLARSDFLAANATTFMLALGEYMEQSIARRSDDLLKHLLRPSSDLIWVLRDGEEVQIPAGEVAVGDTVVVGAGAVIPVDGTVMSGEGVVNEAAMTGESVSAIKTRGAKVLSGTTMEDGRLAIYAEQVGRHTAAARIADYVEQSLTAKSEAQLDAARLADRLVPTVLKLAGVSAVLTGDWRAAASVLQADYSCALKLATPVAFKSAMFNAGQAGILVKGATALERLAHADTFIFDKTGTLTTGHLEITDSIAFDSTYSAEDLICLAASVEEHYFHPLALAVVKAARATDQHRHFDHTEVQFIVAHGVASEVKGQRIVVGSRHFVEDHEGIDVSAHADVVERLYLEGKTLLFIGFGGRLLGILALKDSLRVDAAATIARLRRAGVKRVLMLTGDHRDRAAELADQLGLDGFHAELTPEDKAGIIAGLNAKGAKIAFVGDGVNDAPALAGAHVGVAMQKGADIARLTADVVLLEDSIARVADARALANSAMARIATNYKLTVGLNTAILGLAALGVLSPVATAVLHNGTTIGILLNAFRGSAPKADRRPG